MFFRSFHPERHFGANRSSGFATACVTAIALLLPLISGCDSAVQTPSSSPDGSDEPAVSGKLSSTTIQVPGPPRRLDQSGEFEVPEPGGRYRNPRYGMAPATVWLRRLANAQTWEEAGINAAMAIRSIARMPRGAQRVFFPRLNRTFEGVSHLSDSFFHPPEPTTSEIIGLLGDRFQAGYTLCFVGFHNQGILNGLDDQAAHTFIFPPYWREHCADEGQVRIEAITTIHNHYHLMFEDPGLNCITPTGFFGRMSGGDCEEDDDYAAEPRYLASMGGDEIIRIKTILGGERSFDVVSFANVGNEPVKFRYRNAADQWFQWDNLGGNTNWGVSAFDAVEVLITHAGTSLDCGPGTEAGIPGGCPVNTSVYELDTFVIGL